MIFVGYEVGSKAYRLWNGHKIVISSDVTFDEALFPNKPVEVPVQPPAIQDRLALTPTKASEGTRKQVQFVDIPELLVLNEPPPLAGLLGPKVPVRRPPPPQPPTPSSSAGSPPGQADRVPLPASQETSTPSSPRPEWRNLSGRL